MINALSQLIFNIYEAYTVAFYLRDNEVLKCLASFTFSQSFDKDRPLSIESTLPGWVVKHNEALIISNFDRDEGALGYYGAREDIKSFMGYPMEHDGVIVVDSKRKWVFTDKEKKILGMFCALIHTEIERGKRFEDIEEKMVEFLVERRILNLFNEVILSKLPAEEIFRETLTLANADCCFIGIEKNGKMFIKEFLGTNSDGYLMKECPSGRSIASLVMEGGRELLLPHDSGFFREKPLFYEGEPIKAKQFFGFPLVAQDVVIGVLGFVSLSHRQLKERSIGMLRSTSGLLSLFYSTLWARDTTERLRDVEPVTGAVQFTTFLAMLEKMIHQGSRFSVLSVKLSRVDVYNRSMGYEFTNNVLKRVFQVIKSCLGINALVTRKGGGHFFVLLKDANVTEIGNTMKILNHTMYRSLPEEIVRDERNLIQIGVSHFPRESTDLWGLLDRAKEQKGRQIFT